MGDFHRTNLSDPWAFVRGPARLLMQPIDAEFPDEISDIIELASGASQYDAVGEWTDLGATKTGVTVSVNNAEETFDVDQIIGDIASAPVNWEASVSTALAEPTLEHLQITWEGSDIGTNLAGERVMGYGQPTSYTKRQLAVLYKGDNDLIRAVVLRKVQLQPVESSFAYNKTGEQISIPVQWKALADDTVADIRSRFFVIYEQPGS